ncbi:hypothetical protein GQR58_012382 [Nymphon striatum]|nr:hypothetical protein GQR58_012382 [Nymphon striatum]
MAAPLALLSVIVEACPTLRSGNKRSFIQFKSSETVESALSSFCSVDTVHRAQFSKNEDGPWSDMPNPEEGSNSLSENLKHEMKYYENICFNRKDHCKNTSPSFNITLGSN